MEAVPRMAEFGRVAICGAIATYNDESMDRTDPPTLACTFAPTNNAPSLQPEMCRKGRLGGIGEDGAAPSKALWGRGASSPRPERAARKR